jgi:hypothetical protein
MKSFGKISTGFLVIMIALAIVVVLSTCLSCRSYIAYTADPNYSLLNKEGFTPLHYGTYPNGGAIDIKNRNLINSSAADATAQPIKNMRGLFGPQSLQPKLDTYSDATGSLDQQCAEKSNGMSNSKGYLCLDKSQLQLLQTRGGNQSKCNTCG